MISSFADELEKIAITEAGAKAIKKRVEKYNKKASKPGFKPSKHRPGFLKGIVNNLRATGRRFMRPKRMLSRFKWSLAGPGVPLHMRALAGLGIGEAALHAAPKKDPSGEGKSRLRRALQGAGALIGGTSGRGITGGLAGGAAGGFIGDRAGKIIDELRGYKPPQE
jgi:hypothetical protein